MVCNDITKLFRLSLIQIFLSCRRRVWTDTRDVTAHMVVLISDVSACTYQHRHSTSLYRHRHSTSSYRPTKGAERVCHRSPGLSLTVSRPRIDFVVKCRRNPDTVSAQHPDQPVGPWGVRGGMWRSLSDCRPLKIYIPEHKESWFWRVIGRDNRIRVGWLGLTIARAGVRWLLRAAHCFAQFHSPVGQLRLPGMQGRRWKNKQQVLWPTRSKKYIFTEGRRMWEFSVEKCSNVWITWSVFWVQHPVIQEAEVGI